MYTPCQLHSTALKKCKLHSTASKTTTNSHTPTQLACATQSHQCTTKLTSHSNSACHAKHTATRHYGKKGYLVEVPRRLSGCLLVIKDSQGPPYSTLPPHTAPKAQQTLQGCGMAGCLDGCANGQPTCQHTTKKVPPCIPLIRLACQALRTSQ
jgi:hypothetical protein